MKIALIGYGKMGKMIERMATERGHEVVARIDVDNREELHGAALRSADVAIEFTMPGSAAENVRACMAAGVQVVSGTTGWGDELEVVKKEAEEKGCGVCWSSNFSVGVNIFFALNSWLARVMNGFGMYDVEMEETHHVHKKDAPSGTAITIAEKIEEGLERKSHWCLDESDGANCIKIKAKREGEVPGIHTVKYESEADKIVLTHEAKGREGFAMGAVLAAEFMVGKKGFYTTADVFKIS